MSKINFEKEELLKIAKFSGLKLSEKEIKKLGSDLKTILEYTTELENVNVEVDFHATETNVNVCREDKAIKYDSKNILKNAPQTEDNFFVVPKILK